MADPVLVPSNPAPAPFDVTIVRYGPAGTVAAALLGQAGMSV